MQPREPGAARCRLVEARTHMRPTLHTSVFLALLAVLGATPGPSSAADVNVGIRFGDRNEGDHLRFRSRPRMTAVPGSRVSYARSSDRDVYRYGSYYYGYDGGRWYRSSTYRGPWIYVRGRVVPRAVYSVPADYRRNWRGDYNYWSHRDYDPDWERFQGNGADQSRDMSPARRDPNMTR